MKKISLLTLMFVLFSTPALAESASAELQVLLQQAQSFKGHFEQRLYDREGYLLQTTEGKFVVQRPGNFYWKTLPPFEQLVVSNTDTLWVYDPDLEQVIVHNQTRRRRASPARILSGDLDNLDKHYHVSKKTVNGLAQFTLISKSDDGMFTRLQLNYRDASLAGLEFENSMGQVTKLTFSDTKINPEIDPAIFQFEAPAGVDVIVNE